MPFSINRNNLLYEIFYNYSYLWHVIAHFGKNIFMLPYIIERRRNFVCPSANQFVYTLTLKQRRLQIWNLVQRFWRRFPRRSRSDFLKNQCRFFRMIWGDIFFYFNANHSFISWFFAPLRSAWGLQLSNLVQRCTKEGFWEDLKVIFSKIVPDYLQGLIKL